MHKGYVCSLIKHWASVQSSTKCLSNGYDTHCVLSANDRFIFQLAQTYIHTVGEPAL